MKRDPVFGPVVAFGLGGVLTEALGDVVLAVAPVGDAEAVEVLSLIRAKRLLGPFRGYPAVDQKALGGIVQAIGQMATDNPEIAEIDVNPVMVQGDKPIAADALIILGEAPKEKQRDRRSFKPDLRALLAPRSIAVVGASGEVTKWGGSVLQNIVDGGYKGKIYPVNPKGGVFFGVQSFTSIEALPEAPEMALLAVGGHQVAPMLHDCVTKRISAAIAIAAGFSEMGESGVEAELEIAKIATGIRTTMMAFRNERARACLIANIHRFALQARKTTDMIEDSIVYSLNAGSSKIALMNRCTAAGSWMLVMAGTSIMGR